MNKREQTRQDFPENAKIIDAFTEVFGAVRIDYVAEGGRELKTRNHTEESQFKVIKGKDLVTNPDPEKMKQFYAKHKVKPL